MLLAIGALYAVVSVLGFGLGFVGSRGSVGSRLGDGVVGLFAGWVLIWFVVTIINVSRGTRRALTRPRASAPLADAADH